MKLCFGVEDSPHSYAREKTLMHIAMHVGEFQAMHYKRQPGTDPQGGQILPRPRPSQLSPALMPPIAVPGHASYPSGHSTQSHLLSGLLAQVMPAAATGVLVTVSPTTIPSASLLDRLAERVSRNREVLGLHYPSDTAAGRNLAGQSLPLLLQCPTVAAYVTNAQKEWQ